MARIPTAANAAHVTSRLSRLKMILLFLSMPLICGSVYAFLIFLIYPLLLAKRIKNEEAVLLTGLEGYAEYTRKVRYRLVPFIW